MIEYNEESKKSRLFLTLIMIAAVCAVIGAFVVVRFIITEVKESSMVDDYYVTVLDYDINFSQTDDLATSAVDVLIKLENTSSYPIKSITYSVADDEYDEIFFHNRLDDLNHDEFVAYGFIAPGETGYMYGQMFLPEDTPRRQGHLYVESVNKCKNLKNYTIPSGKITSFDKEADSYDVWILNQNDSDINLQESVVIAVDETANSLAGAWGCSSKSDIKLDYIEAKTDATIVGAIHNPDFDVPTDEGEYKAYVIEKEVIEAD